MPCDVAVQSPYPRVVRHEAQDDMGLRWHGDGVPTHGVVEVPRRSVAVARAKLARPPTYYLKAMAWFRVSCGFLYAVFMPRKWSYRWKLG